MPSCPGAHDSLVHALVQLLAWLRQEGYGFRTVTPATHARVNARPGNDVAKSLRDVFGWSRAFRATLLPEPILLLLDAAGLLGHRGDDLLCSAVRVSSLDGHLFAHSAYPTDSEDAVFFGPDTYRFAQLLRTELEDDPVRDSGRILDIGCGAGPGGILTATHFAASQPETWLCDVNTKALAFAQANASHAGCRAHLRRSDLFAEVEGEFDLIIANPPYLSDSAGRAYRDGGGPRGEALSVRIVQEAVPRLRPGGRLVLYTAAAITDGLDPLLSQVERVLDGSACTWRYRELDPDVFGEELLTPAYQDVERIAAVALTARKASP